MDLDAIDAALAKMTPGDWSHREVSYLPHGYDVIGDGTDLSGVRGMFDREADAEGIVLLRNTAREMVAEIRRLRKLCGEAADNLRDAYDAYRPFYLGEIRDRLRAASKGEL